MRFVSSISYLVSRKFAFSREFLLAITAGLLLGLSFSTFNLSFLVWIGLIPLLFAISNVSPKKAFILSYIAGFVFFFSSMYWLIYVTPAGWIVISLYQALYFGLFGLVSQAVIARRPQADKAIPTSHSLQATSYVIIPALWVVLEYLRSIIGGGIGWNLLGYSQYENLPLIQIADITGVYGISFLIVLVNFAIYSMIRMAIKCQRTHKKLFAKSNLSFSQETKINPLFQTLIIFLSVILVLAYGYKKIGQIDHAAETSRHRLKISVIQPNIEQLHKWDASYKDYILNRLKSLTLQAQRDDPDIIVWPETSIPGYPNRDRKLHDFVKDLALRTDRYILAGAPMIATVRNKDYNSALLFSKEGRLVSQYNKLRLVAFGEFIPLEKYIPSIRNLFPLTGNFISGDEFTQFSLPAIGHMPYANFSVLTCFEDIFPSLTRRFVKKGADFMINITNDAWFGRSAAPYQHAANSVFRAIENRRPFIRSANTGLSCFIDTAGRIYSRVTSGPREVFVDGYITDLVTIKRDKRYTFYTKYGDVFVLACGLLIGLFLIDYLLRRRYNK
ncbi:apolipoprotein N-acyltransferase [Candidatus Omnitrophota bacterium]